jgi:hypothetical protein
VLFSTDGGIVNTGFIGDHVRVNIRLVVDGTALAVSSSDVEVDNFATTGRWSFSVAATLTPGTHMIGVDVILSDLHRMNPGTAWPRAIIGADLAVAPGMSGRLTAVVLKQ